MLWLLVLGDLRVVVVEDRRGLQGGGRDPAPAPAPALLARDQTFPLPEGRGRPVLVAARGRGCGYRGRRGRVAAAVRARGVHGRDTAVVAGGSQAEAAQARQRGAARQRCDGRRSLGHIWRHLIALVVGVRPHLIARNAARGRGGRGVGVRVGAGARAGARTGAHGAPGVRDREGAAGAAGGRGQQGGQPAHRRIHVVLRVGLMRRVEVRGGRVPVGAIVGVAALSAALRAALRAALDRKSVV